MTLLWLDDIRDPASTEVDWLGMYSPIGKYEAYVVWIKSYDEFVRFILFHGLPSAICFDYDLSKSPNKISGQEVGRGKGTVKTGLDCAKWLVKYCKEQCIDIPPYGIQTSNLEGKMKIETILNQYHSRYTMKNNRK